MIVGYIKKQNKPIELIDKIKYFFKIVKVTQCNMGYVLEIPFKGSTDKMINKVSKIIKKLEIDNIVFSNELIYTEFSFRVINNLDKETVCDGRKLMIYMQYDILIYILNIQNIDVNNADVYFLIKKDNDLNLQFLSKFIENCKTVNIVTNDIARFKEVQERIYENENILIGISNNKSKALKRARYILNVNMDENYIKKYKINRDAIIINLKNMVYYNNPGFNGININYMQIFLPDEYIEQFECINSQNEFDLTKLYEVYLMQKLNKEKRKLNVLKCEKVENIEEKIIKQDGIKITGLIGNNGQIGESEFVKISTLNNLTKYKN